MLHTFTMHKVFPMLTVWHSLFSLVLVFPGLRIELRPYIQYRVVYIYIYICIYIYTQFLKLRTRKFNFRSYLLNEVSINISFCLSKVGSPEADLSTISAKIVELSGLSYWPPVPQYLNRAGRFSGHPCQVDQFLGRYIGQPQPNG